MTLKHQIQLKGEKKGKAITSVSAGNSGSSPVHRVNFSVDIARSYIFQNDSCIEHLHTEVEQVRIVYDKSLGSANLVLSQLYSNISRACAVLAAGRCFSE